jgi:spore maturation protein CgeB
MKLVYQGSFWDGSTARQRLEAFRAIEGVTVVAHDDGARPGQGGTLYRRIRWKLGWPADAAGENDRLAAVVAAERPDAVLVDSSKVLRRSTLRALRGLGVEVLAYYTPDDALNRDNLKWPLRSSFPEWDVFFTTKTFNVAELKARGVRDPRLVGKAYDSALHRPMSREAVGEDFERFDLVFAGSCERERMTSLNALCEAGFSVVVYGGDLGKWRARDLHPAMTARPAAFGEAYVRAMHHGKLALGFLRKINRDQITQRSLEITAMGRPMLAEKTDEHDAHFADGVEYAGFRTDDELVPLAGRYLGDEAARLALGQNARRRCLDSGYGAIDRAREMIAAMRAAFRRDSI